jgi:hypothetical protein
MRTALSSDDGGGLRALGGLVFAIGVAVLLIRRTSFEDPWGDFLVFLILALLAEGFYWSGLLGARGRERPFVWQAVFIVIGILLTPVALLQLVTWIGGDTGSSLNTAWIFLFTAVTAFGALARARLRIGALLGGLALIVAWLGLWDELLSDGLDDPDTFRWLLLAIAVILLGLAGAIARRTDVEGAGSDMVTAAGIAAVAAGGLLALVPQFLIAPVGLGGTAQPPGSLFWDVELLVAGLALVGYGVAASTTRGPVYAGTFALLVFTAAVGLDLDDSSPAGKVVGWPLILIVVGALILLASARQHLRRGASA